jgi:hypothetical protein
MNPLVLRWSAPSQGTGSFAAVVGARGQSAAEQAYAAGLIPAPTDEAFAALLASYATRTDVGQTITADHVAVSGDILTVDARIASVAVTLPAAGGKATIRMPEALVTQLVTISGNGRTIDGAASMTSADWAGYEIDFVSSAATWTYAAQYIYGGDA